MPKLHKLTEGQVDDRVLSAVIDEHRQTRRPVATSMVFIAVNAGSGTDQEASMWSLTRLKRAGKIERKAPGEGWSPAAGIARPVPAEDSEAKPNEAPAPEVFDTAPSEHAGCSACGSRPGQFHAPECSAVNAFQAGRIPEALPEIRDPMMGVPKQTIADVNASFGNAVKAMRGVSKAAQEISFTQEHVDPGFSAALLDRCAAMNMALMGDARRRYDAGSTDAASELSWLMETGRQLRDAGGAHD